MSTTVSRHDVDGGYYTGAAIGAFLGAAGFAIVGAPGLAVVFGVLAAACALLAGYEFRRGGQA